MRRKILLSTIILIVTLITGKISYAAIEIVPSKTGDGKDPIVRTSVSNSYYLCRSMKNSGESLVGTNVDVHLATNKDWGAVSYLSDSIYGTNTQGGNTGVRVTINGVNYYSTTNNITGVMNWGSNPNTTMYTQTAGLVSSYTSGLDDITELYANRDSNHVEYLDLSVANNTKGMAAHETNSKYNTKFYTFNIRNYPTSIRQGLFAGSFGFNIGAGYLGNNRTDGSAFGDTTFRPVIWN